MKTDIRTLKDSFKIGYEEFEASRREFQTVTDLLHNRHYTQTQLNELIERGQPAETFNIVKRYHRMFIGYFSSVMNTIKYMPRTKADIERSSIATDMASYILEENDWDFHKDSILGDLIIGRAAYHIDAKKTGDKDDMGRDLYTTEIEYINSQEIITDPLARKPDGSDGRFTHRFKWISEEDVIKQFGKKKLKEMNEFHNFTEAEEAEHGYQYDTEFTGSFKVFNNYLVVHTIVTDDKDKTWSIFWSDEVQLYKSEVTTKEVRPYRVFQPIESDMAEYYGLFRECIEPQKAINQAILQIQMMVNTNKVLVEGDAAGEDLVKFKKLINRVNAVIPVNDLTGIRFENMSSDIVQQYQIIESNIERIQTLLSINDSFLGMADASDSGRKVKLQQNASVVALRYITNKVEFLYLTLGRDILSIMKQFYTAYQMLAVADIDDVSKQKWIEINKPFEMPTGKLNQDGTPETEYLMEEMVKDDGTVEVSPINEEETDLALSDVNVKVVTSAYNDSDDIERMFMDSILQGPVGQSIMNASPQDFFKLVAIAMESTKTRNSQKIADIANKLAGNMEQAPTVDPRLMNQQGGGQGQQGGQAGAMMSAAGMLNQNDPNQGKNTNSGPKPKGNK